MAKYDFSGWATRHNIKCSDGRTIMNNAFKHCDGARVPLVWNHDHTDPTRVVGYADLEHRDSGVYAYGAFNDSALAQHSKLLVEHGDISALSIYANQLQQQGPFVTHGAIREVSLVLAGANPEAFIDSVIKHGEESDEEAIIYTGEDIELSHSDDEIQNGDSDIEESIAHADDTKEAPKVADENKEETLGDILDSMTEKQRNATYAMIAKAVEEAENSDDDDEVEHSEGGENYMKHNVFDQDTEMNSNVLTHSMQADILNIAKSTSVGSFRDAMELYSKENGVTLQHTFTDADTEALFPEYKDVRPGAPELLTRDQSWVADVLAKCHKSPITRIRTRQADARIAELRARGYQNKGDEKKVMAQIKLLSRTTDPQTVYIKDQMHRDDILDITDFDVVEYNYKVMRMTLNEELAMAIMLGDGRADGDEAKIDPEKIRPIWGDKDPYVIHADVDIEAARQELQGTDTNAHFGESYVYAESIITAALYAREKYKGSGSLVFYCTPHLLNVMLLARDLNGRRIYNSVSDIAAALNVTAIHTAEQFENKTRTTDAGEKKLLGIFVNLADYQIGCVKGGEITKFEDFDIDFNRYKYLLETRLSGALTRVYSAIVLEVPVVAATNGGTSSDAEVEG